MDKKFGRALGKLRERAQTLTKSVRHRTLDEEVTNTKVFGEPLGPTTEIPPFVRKCIEYLDAKGTTEQGIFRLSGDYEMVNKIAAAIDRGEDVDFNSYDPLTIAAVLKKYFRELPEPLCTFEYYDCFLAAVCINDKKTALLEVSKLITFLPQSNRAVLAYLMLFLNRLAKHKDKTLMGSQNLAIVFAPNILRSQNINPAAEIEDSALANQLCQIMIDEAQYLFGDVSTNTVSQPVAGVSQPPQPPIKSPVGVQRAQSANSAISSTTRGLARSGGPPASPPASPSPGYVKMHNRSASSDNSSLAKQPASAPPTPPPKPIIPVQTGTPVKHGAPIHRSASGSAVAKLPSPRSVSNNGVGGGSAPQAQQTKPPEPPPKPVQYRRSTALVFSPNNPFAM